MLISNLPNLLTYLLINTQQPETKLISWTLKWQQKQLIVKAQKLQTHQVNLEVADEQRLAQCLQKSPVKLVQIDPALGVANLTIWAEGCKQAKKTIFLRAGKAQKLPYLYPFRWQLKRICDFLTAGVLLLVLSPLILSLIVLHMVKSPQTPLFSRQWRVGKRGQIFELLKFNLLDSGDRNYWQNLPQLFNVLRGEISIVGASPWTLAEATSLQPKQLNALPGLTGIPEIKPNLAIDSISAIYADYLNRWSLGKDLGILFQTMPKIFSGNLN
jgi:lipopolysaccharide/colanic/teichoic acid biosynthesis glycosyltransferase